MRGLAHHGRPALVHDPLAAPLLGGTAGAVLAMADRVGPLTRVLLAVLASASGGRSRFMSIRTRVLDDVVVGAVAEGIDQLVILGAGFDARAWRLGELSSCTVFEVDHPDTQAHKRQRLGDRAPLARDVRFVGVDFEVDSLATRLTEAGFDTSRPAVVLWEGVVMYLPEAAIDATLATLASLLSAGSQVAISYSRTGAGGTALTRRALGVVVGAAGEAFRHHEEPPAMAARVERAGFSVRWDEGHPDWVPRLLGQRQGWDIQRIVLSTNGGKGSPPSPPTGPFPPASKLRFPASGARRLG